MDREAWRAEVHGVAKSQKQLRSEDVGLALFYKKGRPKPTNSGRKKEKKVVRSLSTRRGVCSKGKNRRCVLLQ